MAEREQRGRVDGADLGAPAERRRRGRSRAGRRRPPGRSPAAARTGSTRPVSTPASAGPPSSPGKNACTRRREPVGLAGRARTGGPTAARAPPASRSPAARRAAPPGRPGRRRSAASQPSPEVPRPNSPARSPSTATQTSALARPRPTAAAMPDVARRRAPGSPARSVTSRRQVGAQRLEHRRDLDAHRHVGVLRRRRGAGRSSSRAWRCGSSASGPTTRDPGPARSGSMPSLRSSTTDARPAGAPARGARRRRGRPLARGGGLGRPVRVEQAQLALLQQHPPQRPVDQRLVDAAGADGVEQRLAVAVDGRAARRRCRPPAPAAAASPRSPATPCSVLQEGDGEVVGDDRAGEAPVVAQQVGEQRRGRRPPGRRRCRRRSSSPSAAPPAQRHLERRQDHVGELARRRSTPGRGCGPPREAE